MKFYDIINYIGYFILALNTILYFKSPFLKKRAFKIFSFYLLFISIIQFLTKFFFVINKNNLFLSHYYFIIQFLFLSFFYFYVIKNKKVKKNIKFTITFVLTTMGVYYSIYPRDYLKFNIFEIIVTSIPLIIYSFLFLLKKIDSIDKKYMYISSGLFLYISCSTLLFTAGNIKNSSIKMIIWNSNIVLYLIYQILIFIEWYKNFRKAS